MAEQVVGLRLNLDADDLKRELAASGKAADELAGDMAGMGGKIERVMSGVVDSAANAEQGIRGIDQRLELLTGADRDVFLRANIGQAETSLRQLDQMLTDPTLTDTEISIVLDNRNQLTAQIDRLKDDLGEVGDAAREAAEEGERSFGALAGAIGSAGAAASIDSAVTASGRLQAQLGLNAEAAREFDDVAKTVYRDNFGESMGDAAQATGQVHQALGLVGDDLLATTEGVFSIVDAFEHLGADLDPTLNAVRTMKANFPGMDEAEVLDLIAGGFQTGAGRAGDLIDVLQEYPGDFARIGLSADDMVGIMNEGLDAGVWNADRMGDAVREMGIRVTTAGDLGQIAIGKMFPPAEAERIIRDFGRGGDAGRDAFFTIMEALTAVEDPADRFNLSVELMGSLGEELANQFPGMRDGLLEIRNGAQEAGSGVEGLNSQYDGFRNTLDGWMRTVETGVLGTLGDVGVGFADVGANVGIAVLGLKGLTDIIPGMPGNLRGIATGLGKIAGGAAAYGAAAWGLSQMGDAIADIAGVSGPDISDLRNELELLARTGSMAGDLDMDRISLAIDEIIDPSFWESAGGTVSRGIDMVGQVVSLGMLDLRGTATQYSSELGAIDDALAGMVQSGQADQAAEVFRLISEAVEASGHDASVAADAFPAYATQLDLVAARTGGVAGALADAIFGMGDYTDGMGEVADATEEAVDPMEELETAIKNTNDALKAQFDPFFAVTDAMNGNREAQRKVEEAQWATAHAADVLAEAIKNEGAASREAKDAARALEDAEIDLDQAHRDATRSAIDVATATTDLKNQIADGNLTMDEATARLDEWVVQGLITEHQAESMKEEMFFAALAADELGTRAPRVVLSLESQQFWADLAAARAALTETQIAAQLSGARTAGFQLRHSGGAIHGAPGEEVDIRALAGEYVIRAPAAQALGYDQLERLNRADQAPAMLGTGSSSGASIDYDRLASAVARVGGAQVVVHKGDQLDENVVAAMLARKLA